MASKLEIAGKVMDLVGAGVIVSENDPTKRAKAFKRNWNPSRLAVLCAAKWGFATEQIALAEASNHTPLYGYSKAFEKPAGTLKIWEADDKNWPHRIVGQYVYSNAETLTVTRTKDITEEGLFSPEFNEALAAHIASAIAYNITASREKEQDCRDAYKEALRVARNSNATESIQYAETGSTWLDAAYRGVSDAPGTVR